MLIARAVSHDAGQSLAIAAGRANLERGIRAILAHHVIFHWNRLGFDVGTQHALAHAATTAVFHHEPPTAAHASVRGRVRLRVVILWRDRRYDAVGVGIEQAAGGVADGFFGGAVDQQCVGSRVAAFHSTVAELVQRSVWVLPAFDCSGHA